MYLHTDGKCSICGHAPPHEKLTCKTCGEVYDDCEDWSGPAHAERDCIAKLRRDLDAARAALQPFVDSVPQNDEVPDDAEMMLGLSQPSITMADIRRARVALKR